MNANLIRVHLRKSAATLLLPHYHQHVRESIDYVEKGSAGAVELVRCGLFFSSRRARCHAREFDVVRLKLRRRAKVDLQFVQAFAKSHYA